MAKFEYMTPVIPQLNFKNISPKSYQILESESLNHHNLNLQRMLIQEYDMRSRVNRFYLRRIMITDIPKIQVF